MNSIDKTFISIVVPCYNEEAILPCNLKTIIIDDGNKDKTGEIADEFSNQRNEIKVIHHPVNLNLGHALQTGFRHSKGDIIVVLDVDLSYSVEYIEEMVDKLIESAADIVIASPYMKGGKVTAVPFLRKIMSKWVNKFMRLAAQDKYYTFTSTV